MKGLFRARNLSSAVYAWPVLIVVGCAASPLPNEVQPDIATLHATRAAVFEIRTMLEEYYGGPEVLRDSWILPADAPRYLEGSKALADKFARAIVWRDQFVIGAIGSSVISGSSNCNYDTYSEQLRRTLEPAFAAAGVVLEVRNAGQGGGCGDTFRNQIWCIETLLGGDVDIVHYSWTYFEVGKSDAEVFHEMFYRWALLHQGAPVPQLLYTTDCAGLSSTDTQLLDRYAGFGANILCMERGLKKAGFPGKQWGAVGDTLHETTRYGEDLALSAERRESLGVVFRDWHPGPLLFQLAADALTYSYTDAMLLALDLIATEPRPQTRWPARPPPLAASSLPATLVCDSELCDVESPPSCLTYQQPQFGTSEIRRIEPAHSSSTAEESIGDVWQEWIAEPTFDMPMAEQSNPECAHLDACGGLVAPAGHEAGRLEFELPSLEVGFVGVCCSERRCGERMLSSGVDFELDGKRLEPQVLWNGKCVRLDGIPESSRSDGRKHVLGVHVPVLQRALPAISHVFSL